MFWGMVWYIWYTSTLIVKINDLNPYRYVDKAVQFLNDKLLLSIRSHRFSFHTHHSSKASSQYLMCLVEYLPGKSCSFIAKLHFPLVFKEVLEPYQIKLDEGLWQVYKSFSKEKNFYYLSLWLHWRVTCVRGYACLLLLPIFALIIDTGQWSPESLVADCEWK